MMTADHYIKHNHTGPTEEALEETKGQRSYVTFPKSHSKFWSL